MDYKVLSQNDKISLDIDPEKPKIDSEDVRKKEKHPPHEDPNCAQNSLEAVSLERRSTLLEGKSKYHNFCKFKENLLLKYRTRAIITHGLYTFYPLFEVQKRFFKGLFS